MFQYEKDLLLKIIEELKNIFSDRLNFVVAFEARGRGDFEIIDKEKAEDSLNKAHEFLIMDEKLLREIIKICFYMIKNKENNNAI